VLRKEIPWKDHSEARIVVKGAPPNWGTKDIYLLLKDYGNVVYIEILESRVQDQTEARATFQPPPLTADWYTNGLNIANSAGSVTHQVKFDFEKERSRMNGASTNPKYIPDEIRLPASEIGFGVLQAPTRMLALHTTKPKPPSSIGINVSMQRRCLDITFPVVMNPNSLPKVERLFRMRLNFAQTKEFVKMKKATGEMCFTITMDSPPQTFRKTNKVEGTHEDGARSWSEWQTWYRQTQIVKDPAATRHAITQLRQDSPIIDIGRWQTYCLVFDKSTAESTEFKQLCAAFSGHNIQVIDTRTIVVDKDPKTELWKWLDSPNTVMDQTTALSDLHQLAEKVTHLEFKVRYQLEVCVSLGIIHESNINQGFLHKLASLEPARAVKLLEKVADEKHRFWEPDDIFRQLLHKTSVVRKQSPSHYAEVRSAVVTPTTIYFATPVLEISNRVVRQYSHLSDRFLRVKFTDEKYKGRIMSHDDNSMNEVFSHIKRTMSNGIKVGDRHYEFLAFGNSQFREGGAWFFSSTAEVTAQSIRDWMGNFSDIKVVAKYCSRVGQCFSTTRAPLIGEVNIDWIEDIEEGGYNFTDGVGKISPFLAQMIAHQYKLPADQYPSVLQFRLGGSKGVVAVDPALKGKTVQIRPSQAKFASINHSDLNICRISQFSSANLNIQIVLVLSALGVDDNIFLRKMREELKELQDAMHNSEKAVELLCKNVDFNQMTLQLAEMVGNGFMDVKDPFTISCLRLWHSWTVKYLKEKARIPIEKGAFVLGCVDETATLKGHYTENEGKEEKDVSILPEIFLQVPDPNKQGRWLVITGVCSLARNPSLHPGDIRIVNAVDVPALHHLKNCVVLPQNGDRDLASMCSGGDLDGDDYLVMWDEELLPQEWNHPPMNYDAPPARISSGSVTVDDMTSFFVTHMKHDNLARIAVAHKYWADWEDEGVKSSKCIELAHLHSTAVDYAKTGVPAEMPKRLKVTKWPHWAELKNKAKKHIYYSNKVIGKLYNMVQRIDFIPAWDLPPDKRILEAYQLDEEILEAARALKSEYDAAIGRLMARFGVKSDFEVFTTFALEHSEDFGDYKFAETIGEAVGATKDHFRNLCYEKAGTTAEERDPEKIARFAAAMYTATAQELTVAANECKKSKLKGGQWIPLKQPTLENMPFMSFPWLFEAELGRIANKGRLEKRHEVHHPIQPIVKPPKTKPKPRVVLTEAEMPAPLEEIQTRGLSCPSIQYRSEVGVLEANMALSPTTVKNEAEEVTGLGQNDMPLPTTVDVLPDTNTESVTSSYIPTEDVSSVEEPVVHIPEDEEQPVVLISSEAIPSSTAQPQRSGTSPAAKDVWQSAFTSDLLTEFAGMRNSPPQVSTSPRQEPQPGADDYQTKEAVSKKTTEIVKREDEISEEEEVEEVMITLPNSSSAFDALEKLLGA
jgi:RNA-dependent RNA polymerase